MRWKKASPLPRRSPSPSLLRTPTPIVIHILMEIIMAIRTRNTDTRTKVRLVVLSNLIVELKRFYIFFSNFTSCCCIKILFLN